MDSLTEWQQSLDIMTTHIVNSAVTDHTYTRDMVTYCMYVLLCIMYVPQRERMVSL